jgi:hypothetical protein
MINIFLLFVIHFTLIICLLFKLRSFDATNSAKTVSTKSYMLLNQYHAFVPHEPHVTLVEYEMYLRSFIFLLDKTLDG